MMPQTEAQYRKAFQKKTNETKESAEARMTSRLAILIKEGKVVSNETASQPEKATTMAKSGKGIKPGL